MSTVPQGVLPPAQLLMVPKIFVPVGSALVISRWWPAAGPETRISVSSVIRRAYWLSGTTVQAPLSLRTSITEPLCAIISIRVCSGVCAARLASPIALGLSFSGLPSPASSLAQPGNISSCEVYS
jgi:hypothetical protein